MDGWIVHRHCGNFQPVRSISIIPLSPLLSMLVAGRQAEWVDGWVGALAGWMHMLAY